MGPMSTKNRTPQKGTTLLSPAAADAMLRIDELSIAQIERLAAEAYRVRGYVVRATEGDWLVTKDSQRVLLQCKHWKARKIGEMPVRELYGSMAAYSATSGVLISTGTFTLEATRFAGFGGIELLDGPKLLALLQRLPGAPEHLPAAPSLTG
jgi:restriction system protein